LRYTLSCGKKVARQTNTARSRVPSGGTLRVTVSWTGTRSCLYRRRRLCRRARSTHSKPKKGTIKTLGLGAGKRGAGEEEEEEEEESSPGDRVLEQGFPSEANLTMDEVQGSVRMGAGSTGVLRARNSGRGKIRAEGVVGPARGFIFAGAAATVVSLWGVHDGSTAALKKQMYKQQEDGAHDSASPGASHAAPSPWPRRVCVRLEQG